MKNDIKEEKKEEPKEEKKYVTTQKETKNEENELKEEEKNDRLKDENLSEHELRAKYVKRNEILLTKIYCKEIEKTPLSELDKITIKVDQPKKIEGGIFSKSYITYAITTEELNLSVRRRFNDFEWLRNILMTFFPQIIIPRYAKVKNAGDRFGDDFTKKRMRTLEKFLTFLIKDPLLKSSQIIYDFLSIKEEEFINKKNAYNKTKSPSNLNELKSNDGVLKVILNQENENFNGKVKNNSEINALLFKQLSLDFKDLRMHMENMSQSLKNLSVTFDKLTKNKFANDEFMGNAYENLKDFMNNWSDSLKIQSELIEVNLRELFKFCKKEYNVIKDYAIKVDNFKNNYYKQEEKLQNKKQYYFEKVDVSKWEINSNEIIDTINIKQDKELAFLKMIPKETESVYQTKLIYGFYTEKLVEEYNRTKKLMGKDIHEIMINYFSQQNKIVNAFNQEVEHIFHQIKNLGNEEIKSNENESQTIEKPKVNLFEK